jgi:transcription-repair coupling factor (superfamily II helicase)
MTHKVIAPEEPTEPPTPAPTADTVAVDLPLEAHLPVEYIPHDDLRLRLYRRMAEMTDPAVVDEFAQELADRFGPIPEPALNLVYLLRVKVLAALAGVESVIADEENITLRVRDRLTLIEWKPSPEVEADITVG